MPVAQEDRVRLGLVAQDDRVVTGWLRRGNRTRDHASDFDVVVRHEEDLRALELAVIRDDRDPGVERGLERRQDRLRVHGVEDEDIDARRDQGRDVRRLDFRLVHCGVSDVLSTTGREGGPDPRLIPKPIALFLERGPGHAHLARAGRSRGGRCRGGFAVAGGEILAAATGGGMSGQRSTGSRPPFEQPSFRLSSSVCDDQLNAGPDLGGTVRALAPDAAHRLLAELVIPVRPMLGSCHVR